ncbi:AAA ATPase central domain protein [Heterosigma akashiwo virus 01]|uniref:AAA ATPase central domain protein n=1 Tax=Heterosigma akashiwo virus 01 TaxID=97195 RepID=A0A1C9C4Z7_HAV01|nr:AAA ATPase central domain protein [Heterosigma akashiwo virus 01]AOM63361.1 AAA ATPase central domain protein [Heterosigma akashiwo virus 01]
MNDRPKRSSKTTAEQKIKSIIYYEKTPGTRLHSSGNIHHIEKKDGEKGKKEKNKNTNKKSSKKQCNNSIDTFLTDKEINTLSDLIEICETYNEIKQKKGKISKNKIYHEGIEKLCDVLEWLYELNKMIGLKHVKETVVNQLIYIIQDLTCDEDLNHIQVCANPGTGKTTLAIILGKIFAGLGMLSNGDVITATRSDLIGNFLGETALKTTEVMLTCKGNVLLLDEVYSLGSPEQRDSFSKECIDTINQFLTEFSDNLLCIIVGYEDDIQKCFFDVNKGLERRFPWKYRIDDYTMKDLKDIFCYQVNEIEWELDENVHCILENNIFIDSNKDLFKNQGGDTLTLLGRCKIFHARRIFKQDGQGKFILSKEDVLKGMDNFKVYKEGLRNKQIGNMMMYL